MRESARSFFIVKSFLLSLKKLVKIGSTLGFERKFFEFFSRAEFESVSGLPL